MSRKLQINNIEELNEIVVKASKIRDELLAFKEAEKINTEWKEIAILIHEKGCKKGKECSWDEEHNLDFDIEGKIISDEFINWNGSERLIYAAKAKQLLFEYDKQTISTILNIL